jgi:hypothetical protein
LHFPKAAVGKLWITNHGADPFSYKPIGDACGDVTVAPGMKIGLKLSFAGFQDLSFLKRMDVSVMTRFEATRMDFDDTAAANLQNLKELQILDLNNTEIDDQALKYIGSLKHLQWLNVGSTNATGKGLTYLSGLSHITDFSMMYCNMADADLELLRAMPLTALRLSGSDIADKALEPVGKMKDLKALRLARNKRITDKGIAYLAKLSKVTELDLSDTAVTPACAQYVRQMGKLKHLYISYHSYTPAQIAAFRSSLPGIDVVDRTPVSHETDQLFAPLHSPIAPQGHPAH